MKQIWVYRADVLVAELSFEGEALIGRAAGSVVLLEDVSVSRRHARIVERDGGLFIIDEGSTQGTTLWGGGTRMLGGGGQRLAPGELVALDVRDAVDIGAFTLRFLCEEIDDEDWSTLQIVELSAPAPACAPPVSSMPCASPVEGGDDDACDEEGVEVGDEFDLADETGFGVAMSIDAPFVLTRWIGSGPSDRTMALDREWGREHTAARSAECDNVDCALFAPEVVSAGADFMVQVFLHLPELAEEAIALAREFDKEAVRRGRTTLDLQVERGTRFRFELRLPGVDVETSVLAATWRGRTTGVTFVVSVPEAAAAAGLVGRLLVFQGTVPVGRIAFKLAIAAKQPAPGVADAEPRGVPRRFRQAFVSYASQDRAEVVKRVQMCEALRLDYFQDLLSLDPGDRWEQKLYHHIDTCDVFLLFWSTAAKSSRWVGEEIGYALTRQGADPEQLPDIVPVVIEGPPGPQPPESLRHLHFADRLLYFARHDPDREG